MRLARHVVRFAHLEKEAKMQKLQPIQLIGASLVSHTVPLRDEVFRAYVEFIRSALPLKCGFFNLSLLITVVLKLVIVFVFVLFGVSVVSVGGTNEVATSLERLHHHRSTHCACTLHLDWLFDNISSKQVLKEQNNLVFV
jgi:hypothetical protein